jgi:hypothetical protein
VGEPALRGKQQKAATFPSAFFSLTNSVVADGGSIYRVPPQQATKEKKNINNSRKSKMERVCFSC